MSGMTVGEFYWLWPKKKNAGGTGVFERKNYTGVLVFLKGLKLTKKNK